MEKNVIQITGGITINVNVSVKKLMYVKKNMFGILVNVFVKIENIQPVLCLNQTYYFFNDIRIENFDVNNIRIAEKSYKNILIYHI